MLQRLGVQRFMLQRLLLQKLMIQMLRLQKLMLQRLMLQRFMLHVYTFIHISDEILMVLCKHIGALARAQFLGNDRISLEVSQVEIYYKESRIQFRNVIPVDVLYWHDRISIEVSQVHIY